MLKNVYKQKILIKPKFIERISSKISESNRLILDAFKIYKDYLWEVGYSGGKDSTVVLHLIVENLVRAIRENLPFPKKILILYSDTLLDLPELRNLAISTLKKINHFARELKIEKILEAKILKPRPGEDFFSIMIERGYPIPHWRFRWCVQRLKLNPTLDLLDEITKKYKTEKIVMVSGIRNKESSIRARNIKKRNQKKALTERDIYIYFSPIIDWTDEDVWSFLYTNKAPWGTKYSRLISIYNLTYKIDLKCTNEFILSPTPRFGCWVCTLIKKDKMLENIIQNTKNIAIKSIYKELLNVKKRIIKISNDDKKKYREVREGKYKYGKLNQIGRDKIIQQLARVIIKAPIGLDGYLEDEKLFKKLKNWLSSAHNRHPRWKYLKKAIKLLKAYEEFMNDLVDKGFEIIERHSLFLIVKKDEKEYIALTPIAVALKMTIRVDDYNKVLYFLNDKELFFSEFVISIINKKLNYKRFQIVDFYT